jgi:hypothetical protein
VTSKEVKSDRAELRKEKTLTDQLLVKNAVDTRKFIIKLDRLYTRFGSPLDIVPRENYIIIDGARAIINTAYLGRQWDIRGIAAINMKGRAQDYAVTSKLSKGSYVIKLTVRNGSANTFDVNLNISKNGYCSASVSSLKIENIRYSGYLVPIPSKTIETEEGNMI